MAFAPVTCEQVRRVPLFAEFSEDQLDAVVRASTVAEFSRNQVIFHENDNGTALFVILNGRVKVSLVRPDGKEAILAILTPGEFFGEMALLDNRPRSASVVVLEPTTVMILTRSDFMQMIEANPQIIHNMIIPLVTRLRKADKKIADLAFLDAIGRVSGVISQMAEESGEEVDEGIIIRNRPSHEQLGMMAATTRETVTHCMATLERRGYILSDGRDLIVFSINDLRKDFLVPR
jgi:CRP/FNR family transcriptional regulator/CRP/FNR family cyclic AMP-dependent transcriptional regulator